MSKDLKDKGKLQGLISIKVYDKDGNVKITRDIHNLITDAGLAGVAARLGTDSTAFFNYLAVGTGSTAATASNTTLGTEIGGSGARALATASQVTTTVANDTHQLLKTFAFTASYSVTECGIFNASSSGTLLGRQVFTAVAVESGDSLQITYKVSVA